MKSEFEFISTLQDKVNSQPLKSRLKIGIGDDCAVMRQNSKTDLLVTTDLLVEDIDFRLEWTTPEFLGHKALAVSLSDIAAMGGRPLWALVSIGIPASLWQTDFINKFYQGWLNLAREFNVVLAGGDLSRTPDKLVIDSIVAGEVRKNRAILRSGAKPGDLIFVTGSLGGAAGGLKLLENGSRFETSRNERERNLLYRQLCPAPQTKIGVALSQSRLATAMIDLSDGLSSDLAHLCKASNVGARIEAGKIPLDKNLFSFSEFTPEVLGFALNGGEDFELLFTVEPKNENKIKKLFSKISAIGEIMEKSTGIKLTEDFRVVALEPKGFSHF